MTTLTTATMAAAAATADVTSASTTKNDGTTTENVAKKKSSSALSRLSFRNIFFYTSISGVIFACLFAQGWKTGFIQRQMVEEYICPSSIFNPFSHLAVQTMSATGDAGSLRMNEGTIRELRTYLGDINIEIGPGTGETIDFLYNRYGEKKFRPRTLYDKIPMKTYAFELSPMLRRGLKSRFADIIAKNKLIVVDNPNPLNLTENTDIIPTMISKIYGSNVLYFLDPLQEYMEEYYRILAVGGRILFTVSAQKKVWLDHYTKRVMAENGDDIKSMIKNRGRASRNVTSTVGKFNTNWQDVMKIMRKVGFAEIALQGPNLDIHGKNEYWSISAIKPTEKMLEKYNKRLAEGARLGQPRRVNGEDDDDDEDDDYDDEH